MQWGMLLSLSERRLVDKGGKASQRPIHGNLFLSCGVPAGCRTVRQRPCIIQSCSKPSSLCLQVEVNGVPFIHGCKLNMNLTTSLSTGHAAAQCKSIQAPQPQVELAVCLTISIWLSWFLPWCAFIVQSPPIPFLPVPGPSVHSQPFLQYPSIEHVQGT